MSEDISDGLKAVRKFGAFTFGATIVGFALRLIKSIIFTRLLGPANRGIFGLFITLPRLVVSFGNMGFGLGTVYLVANRRYNLKKIFGNTLLMVLCLGSLLSLIGYFVFSQSWILKENNAVIRNFLPWVLMAIPVVLLYEFSTDLIVAVQDIHFANILNLTLSALPILIFALLWTWFRDPLSAAVYAWVAGMVVVSCWATLRIYKKTGYALGLSKRFLGEALSYGRRGFINIFANQLILRIDFLFVSSMLGAEALGYYAVSVSLVEILLSLPSAFNLPFLPVRLGMAEEGSSNLTSVVIRHVLCVMVFACGFTAVAGKVLIWVLFGRRFSPAYFPLLWLLPGILFLSVYNFLRSDLYSHNLPGFVSWVSIAALISNVVLNCLLIPLYGISGAAISSSVAYGLSTCLLLRKYHKLSGNPYRDILIIKHSDLITLWRKVLWR